MATQVQAPPVKPTPSAKPKPGTPFGGAIPFALIGLVSSAIGFFPTFFVRLDQVDLAHLVHGWTMIGWLVLVLVQAMLIRNKRYRVHRVLGWSSLALFVAMMVTSCQMVILMLSGKSGLPYELAKFFAYSDIMDTPLMLILFGGAIVLRKNRHLHSRLVAATVMVSIVPGLARMFNILIWRSMEGLYTAMHPTYLLILAALGAAIYADYRNKRLRWPLPLAFVWFLGVYATQWIMMDAPWYLALTRSLASLA